MEIEQFVYLDHLYSIYKSLLTEKQNEILSLYLEEDFSLGEISEELGISRQAAHDAIKRSEQLVHDYEQRLGLYQKEQKTIRLVQQLTDLIVAEQLEESVKQQLLAICKEIQQ